MGRFVLLMGICAVLAGCVADQRDCRLSIPGSLPPHAAGNGESLGVVRCSHQDKEAGKDDYKNGKEEKPHKPPETLFEWAIGPKSEEKEDEQEEEKRMPFDRPHFTDSSGTVGRGRVMFESGYGFATDSNNGTRRVSHSILDDTTLRVGLFADWFEARLQWGFLQQRTTELGTTTSLWGSEDLAVGMRLALTEQKCYLPEMALNFMLSMPTGSPSFTSNMVLPELRLHCTWEIVKDVFEIETNTIAAQSREESGHVYTDFAQSINLEYFPRKDVQFFFEWFGVFPFSALSPETRPLHVLHGGIVYFLTSNFAIDVHAGFGLNRSAEDFFGGTGLILRY